ncbi:DNA replication initiation control protein YabA [Streptococcus dentiloxodontae]
MDKRDLFDKFDDFSQNLMLTLAEVEAMKGKIDELINENTALKLENDKLRERLSQVAQEPSNKPHHGKDTLEAIYDDGFHICTFFYGQRRENDDACAFCSELLYGD